MLNVQIDPSKGLAGGGVCVLPLNLPGISRGKALDKVGQRDLPQGELFFHDVRIPNKYMFVAPENYSTWTSNNLAFGNAAMIRRTSRAVPPRSRSCTFAKTSNTFWML